MREIAQGDLCATIENRGGAGGLLGALTASVRQLRGMTAEIGSYARAVASNARETAVVVTRGVANEAQGQSDATSSIAAGVEEMTVSINHISDSAREIVSYSCAVVKLAERGEVRGEDAAGEMSPFAVRVGDASGTFRSSSGGHRRSVRSTM